MDSRQSYLSILEDLTVEFEDERFVFEGTDWWPLIKVQAAYQMHLLLMKKDEQLNQGASIVKSDYHFNLKNFLYYWVFKSKHYIKGKRIAVFTSGNQNITKDLYSGSLINQYTHPFTEYFDTNKIKYDLYDIDLPVGNGISISRLKLHFLSKVNKQFNRNIKFQDQLLRVSNFLKNKVQENFNIFPTIVNTIFYNQSTYLAYNEIFEKLKYSKIVYYCYYNNQIMAINRAARERGISTVEYQHSHISNQHFAYSGWTGRIKNAEFFFPNYFLAWSGSDVNLIKKNFIFLNNSFSPILGGNLYLNKFLKDVKENRNSQLKILVTLQGVGLPEFIQNYIVASRNMLWYLRLHPRYPLDKEMVEKLKKLNPENIDIEKANDASLIELLSEVSYNITCFSGSALEAQAMGVQNIIFGADGYNSYREQIETKDFIFINNTDELDEALENLKMHNKSSNYKNTKTNFIYQNLATLFE